MEWVLAILAAYTFIGWRNGRRDAAEAYAEARILAGRYRYQPDPDPRREAAAGFWRGALLWPVFLIVGAWDRSVAALARAVVPAIRQADQEQAEAAAAERIRILDLETAAVLERRRLDVEREAYDAQHRLDLEAPRG